MIVYSISDMYAWAILLFAFLVESLVLLRRVSSSSSNVFKQAL